ncbi:MAG TPA: DNA polymerase III subunit delta [Nitrospiraceae bacterium]|nr:MAG: DNA polymerase III subunit delta [Nitrospirae bacterium GWA2_46_11]OGW22780.1 MAG: DNA polymerase III subunit delta [Nitrospirae bacterium GWB2_47_37]HAK89792.1 DNA polymerase III subunit delta [Nitrospiraceae bacterium]HCL81776.1 DNA polymerase III subunit delta [Nitrospiraceae bacterium]HCZ11027.1 DNA polymerase III subunit delta [Nitrospiraceae bacterium]
MSIKQFQQELSKELPSPAYLFYSSENFLLHEALSAVKERYQGADAFNFDVFDIKSPDDAKPMEQMVDVLNTLPFLSERRVVVIQNIQKIPKKDVKKIEDYLSAPSNTSLLIMLFEGTSPKLFDASVSKNMKTIGLNVPEKEIPLWITGRAKGKGVELTDRAVEYLINCVGTDLGMLSSEIEKFSSWNTSRVDMDDIKGMVYAGAEYSAFDLVNALRNKDKKEVFRIFENVSKNSEPQMLLGALNWQYASLRSRTQDREERAFNRVFRLLHEADAGIKTSKSHVMEDLLIKLLKN